MSVEIFSPSFCAPWHVGEGLVYVISSLLFFDITHILTSKYFVAWKSNPVLHTIFSAFSLVPGTILTDLLCVGLVGQLSLVLPVRCHCTSHQFGSSRRLTLLEYLRWPWILPQDSFGFPQPLEMDNMFHCLKPSLPRKPAITANYTSLLMLDASKG